MIVYRPMTEGDIPEGLALCRSAGWNQTAADWDLFLQLSPSGCRVAVDDDGKVRGTVTTVRYGDHFSWVGMVLVDPASRRQGIGIQLLREALHVLSAEQTVKLDATPAGREVYLQLDFADEYPIGRMQLKKVVRDRVPDTHARPVTHADLRSIVEFDATVFGADRRPVLNAMLKRAPQYAFLCEEDGEITGYCFGRMGHEYAHIGPVIATDPQTATALVSAPLLNCGDWPVIIDVLHHTPEWLQWLASVGFAEQRPLIRMYRGSNAHPGIPDKQFAILGPEFG
ncbi:MAG TPA: GNAT family N-acetyltransferase [Chryseosolibacter sp.]